MPLQLRGSDRACKSSTYCRRRADFTMPSSVFHHITQNRIISINSRTVTNASTPSSFHLFECVSKHRISSVAFAHKARDAITRGCEGRTSSSDRTWQPNVEATDRERGHLEIA